jgi:hypothetical protein
MMAESAGRRWQLSDLWLERASRLAEALSRVPRGEKTLQTERIAEEHGLSHKTVEQLLKAHGFLQRLCDSDPEVAKKIIRLPYQAVMALERWYGRDRARMLEFLESNPRPSVRTATAAEKISRGSTASATPAEHAIDVIASTTGPVVPGEAMSKLLRWAGMDLPDLRSAGWKAVSQKYERALGIGYLTAMEGGHRLALLAGPSSQTSGHYSRHAKSIWFNAVCATTLHSIIIVLLPSKAAQSAVLTSMPLPPSGQGDWPDWNPHAASRGKPQSGPMRPASPKGGVIMFTTPETIVEDWQT